MKVVNSACRAVLHTKELASACRMNQRHAETSRLDRYRWIVGYHALHDSHATRFREAGFLTTKAQMHSVLSVSVSISISIVAPRRLGTETLRDHGRQHEPVEQREQHEQVYVGREGLHGERYHAAALRSGWAKAGRRRTSGSPRKSKQEHFESWYKSCFIV